MNLDFNTCDQVIANVEVRKIFTLILPDNLLDELFRLGYQELGEHLVLDIAILSIEAFCSPLLHRSEYRRYVYAPLMYLSTDLALFDQLLNHLLYLLLFDLVSLR